MKREDKVLEIEAELNELKQNLNEHDIKDQKTLDSILHRIDQEILEIPMDSDKHSKFNFDILSIHRN